MDRPYGMVAVCYLLYMLVAVQAGLRLLCRSYARRLYDTKAPDRVGITNFNSKIAVHECASVHTLYSSEPLPVMISSDLVCLPA